MATFPTVLVLLAFDARDEGPLAFLADHARRLGVTRVVLLHLSEREDIPQPLAETRGALPSVDQASMDACVERIRAHDASLTLVSILSPDDPATALAQVQRDHGIDLVVMGRGDDEDAPLPVPLQVLRHLDESVLTIPQGTRVRFEDVVVGLDFSDTAIHALNTALGLCDDVEAVTQYDPRSSTNWDHPKEFDDQLIANIRKHLDDHLPVSGRAPTVSVRANRKASEALIEAARGRTIIVGTRGLSRISSLLLGSTAERLILRSAAPVLVLRKAEARKVSFLESLVRR